MRTNISLDEDVRLFATVYAASRRISLSAALNELVRKAEVAPRPAPEICHSPNGLPCFPPTGDVVTHEMIRKIQDDLDDEEAGAA